MFSRKLLFRTQLGFYPCVDFSSKGKHILGGRDNKQILDAYTGKILGNIEGVEGHPRFESDSLAWTSLDHRGAKKWRAERWQVGNPSLVTRLDHSRGSNGMAISENMRWVATSQGKFNRWNSGIWLEDLRSRELRHLKPYHDTVHTTEDPSFSFDNRLVASCVGSVSVDVPDSGQILIWETDTVKSVPVHMEPF